MTQLHSSFFFSETSQQHFEAQSITRTSHWKNSFESGSHTSKCQLEKVDIVHKSF